MQKLGNSLAVQWLGLGTAAVGPGSIPGWGTKIPQVPCCSKKLRNKIKQNCKCAEIRPTVDVQQKQWEPEHNVMISSKCQLLYAENKGIKVKGRHFLTKKNLKSLKQIYFKENIWHVYSGRRKRILSRKLEVQEEMKSNEKCKYMGK